jgi:Ras-related protein Rab-4B
MWKQVDGLVRTVSVRGAKQSSTHSYFCCIQILKDALFLETSSLTGENVETPFSLASKSILLAIDSGRINPEISGSGISYGDRGLRRVGSNGNLSSRFSFTEMMPSNNRGSLNLNQVKQRFDGCC